MNLRMTTLGVQAAIRGLDKARRATAPKIKEGLDRCAASVLRKARFYVPKDTGALDRSGKIIPAEGSGYGARAAVTFGGEGVGYAVRVHEDLEMRHTPPTCAKFLERATRELSGTLTQIMGRTVESKTVTLDLGAPEPQPGE